MGCSQVPSLLRRCSSADEESIDAAKILDLRLISPGCQSFSMCQTSSPFRRSPMDGPKGKNTVNINPALAAAERTCRVQNLNYRNIGGLLYLPHGPHGPNGVRSSPKVKKHNVHVHCDGEAILIERIGNSSHAPVAALLGGLCFMSPSALPMIRVQAG